MKVDELYRQIINEEIDDLPSLGDFPDFKAPTNKLPDENISIKTLNDTELNYYYELASNYLAAAEDAVGSYLSKEHFVWSNLEHIKNVVFRENFSGKDKGGNAENRNSIVETDPRVLELKNHYLKIKAQRQKMERKVKGISQKVIIYGGERKQRRESKWRTPVDHEETF